jgi:predicted CoA-binding protein
MHHWYQFEAAEQVLRAYSTFAVVGCSDDPTRPSHGVARTLIARGYQVVPVNPNVAEVQGLRSYPDLASAATKHDIDVVDLFRRSEHVSDHVDEAIAIGARAIWMQLGVIDEEAAARAEDAGLIAVMDRCPAIDLRRVS